MPLFHKPSSKSSNLYAGQFNKYTDYMHAKINLLNYADKLHQHGYYGEALKAKLKQKCKNPMLATIVHGDLKKIIDEAWS